jgi:hypothetical protein
MANQAIGLTHVLPNAEFATPSTGSITTTLTTECLIIPISDLGVTATTGGSSYSIVYTDATGTDTTYTGNADLILQSLISKWYTRFKQISDDYTADQAKATASQQDTDPPPSACTSTGFTSYTTSGSTGNKLRNQITVNFLYEEPSVSLVDDGDV